MGSRSAKRAKDAERAKRYRIRQKSERDASRSVTRDDPPDSSSQPETSAPIPERDASRSVTRDASRLDAPQWGHSDLVLDAMAKKVRVAWARRVEKLGAGIWNDPHCPAVMDIARWVLSLPEEGRLEAAGRALDAYFQDDFARQQGFPIRMFARNPQKYALKAAAPKAAVLDKDAEWLVRWKRDQERAPWN